MVIIDRIDTSIIDVPTVRGHVLSMTTMLMQSVVIVQIRFSDGSEGWGEGASIGGLSYGPECVESIKLAIDSYISPVLIGTDGEAIASASNLMARTVKGNHAARAAVETALWDGLGRRLGVPVATFFGGRVRECLPVAWTLASGNSQTDIDEAEKMLQERRHRDFKLKIGKRAMKDDLAHVAAIARAVGDRGTIRVDLNQAWTLTNARYGVRGLQEMGCVLVEQPVAREQLSDLKTLTDTNEIAIMADEVLQGPHDAMRLAANRSADVFAVKVCQSGGLAPAAQVIAIAQAAGIDLYGGTMLESGLGTATALQLFATVEHIAWGTEFFGPLLLVNDILAEPLVYHDFSVVVPTGPGIGVLPDPEKVDFFRRDRTPAARALAAQ
ncbi:muconate cycloisomerase family protein [Mesorhizobium sp. DCY119]|uniref:muconate cycloisomerase family protein n=1 Tax=Mesorhizobium sp. DCY119 TaxID=2108445 RepID=UPI000E746DA5|nr:muconate cycloisomerase family protein [Mesorhizobium sp. DCY119]RJG40459.1 muconate cycloisomerase [Mesorhizobium sp. DCY119]